MAGRNGSRHATLYDFRDLDLLLKLKAEGDPEGWLDTENMARSLGFEEAAKLSSRLTWMRRYGMLEFDGQRRLWRLTPGAERVTAAKLRASQANVIEALPDEAMVEVMAGVATRYRLGDPMVATMLRREFLFGTAAR
jgi:hypothetical protein